MKKCNTCNLIIGVENFNKSPTSKDGYVGKCKSCYKEYKQNYRINNLEKVKEIGKKTKFKNKIKLKETRNKWINNNKKIYLEKRRNYVKQRILNDNLYKMKTSIKSIIRNSFKKKGINKNSKTSEILGCSFEEFKSYLESKFESWMNWDNKGLYNGSKDYGWDIDHIIPLSSATTEDRLVKLNHFTNLQPLCSYYNRNIKKDKY